MGEQLITSLSKVDGVNGVLTFRGEPVASWVAKQRFASAMAGLWQRPVTEASLGRGRVEAFERLQLGEGLADGMDELRRAVAALPPSRPEVLVGAVHVVTGSWLRRRHDRPVVAPDSRLPPGQDLLRMAGMEVDPVQGAALEQYWIAVMDHGLNASTFAARVVASTGSDSVSAVVAAIGALKGPLHGGAPGPVLDMLDAIGREDRAERWLGETLARGERIMGMGHRVYRVRDPRAAVLEQVLLQLGESPRLALARHVEQTAERMLAERHPDRALRANVEFYTALLLDGLGMPREAFTPLFACGRVAGWLAHIEEQRATGRLIRPIAEYRAA